MNEMSLFRALVERFLIAFLWGNVALLAGVGFFLSGDGVAILTGALILAGGATLTARLQPGSAAARHAIGVALMGLVSLLVFAFEGHPWQIDIHMYFFAALAMLAAFCDWRTLMLSAAVVALHHLVLNFLYPAAVFPGGAALGRVLLHALIVVVEVSMLCWLSWRLSLAFTKSEQALQGMAEAQSANEAATAERDRLAQAERDTRRAVRVELAQRFQDGVGGIVANLSGVAQTTRQSALEINRRLEEVGVRLSTVLDRTGQVEAEVDLVAGSANELVGSVAEVNRYIGESTTLAGSAVQEVHRTNVTVESLAQAAHRIGDVVGLIQDIAAQTNLLALNATIEAARAGDAGKGFAVVAGEVKHLANQTARATEEIGAQIAEIQSVTGGAVQAIRDIGATIGRIEQAIGTIAAAADRQSASIDTISRSARIAVDAVGEVGSNLGEVTGFTESLAAISTRQTEQASHMASDVDGLVGQVDAFVGEVRRG
jgi:methyl-accepting chemotaxis protein